MWPIVVVLTGLGLVAAPTALGIYGHPLGAGANVASVAAGTFLLVSTALAQVFLRLYRRTRANEAFVRTGAGGARVIRDGGSLVLPVMHDLLRVSLQTFKLEVERENEDALITHDKLRADVRAEFFVRVQPDAESILQAARSLGDKLGDAQEVKELVEDKLVSALRTAAASKTLDQLNGERDEFLAEVMKLVGDDLRSNGLVLETVTISRLDQTDERFLKEANIFDAQGRRKIAAITQENLTERNRLVREGERVRKLQDVDAREDVLALERREKEVEARVSAEVTQFQAESQRDAHVRTIEARRQVELADVEKTRTLELALREQQQEIEIAERQKQERIAQAEARRANAESALADAEADRERATQRVTTVRVTEEAERAKRQMIIEAEAGAERDLIVSQRRADAESYSVRAQAEARKAAADAEAEAVRKRAGAAADAEQQHALGVRATAMVPVDVERARLELDRERIEMVVKAELEAREKHGRVAQDFELEKLRIEAEKAVRVAVANAQASLFAKMTATLYGTPEDVRKIMGSLVQGQTFAKGLHGFFEGADEPTRAVVGSLAAGVGELAGAVAKKLRPEANVAADAECVDAADAQVLTEQAAE